MADTQKYDLRYPILADSADVPRDVKNLADDVDAKMAGWSSGTLAARPAPGKAGLWYRRTDGAALYVDDGSVWIAPVLEGDARLTNARAPTQESVVNSSVSSTAAIGLLKLADGAFVFLGAESTGNEEDVDNAEFFEYTNFNTVALPFNGTVHVLTFQHGYDTRGGIGSMTPQNLIGGVVMPGSIPIDISSGRRVSVAAHSALGGQTRNAVLTIAYRVSIGTSPVRWKPQGHTTTIAFLVKS